MNWNESLDRLRRMEWFSVVATGVLMVFGILYVYSASFRSEDLPISPFYRKQIVWAVAGLFVFMAVTLTDYRKLRDAAWWMYVISLVLLVAVLLVGKKVYGAYRWLSFFGLQVQPSEFAKLSVLISLAGFLCAPGRAVGSLKCLIQIAVLVGAQAVLILKEPDLGTTMVLVPVSLSLMYAAGVPLRVLGWIALVAVLMAPLAWLGLGDYQKERIEVFLDPGRDPLGTGWNNIQSELAIGSGGFWGKGYLKGTQNVLGFLPRTVAPTDFIYSVIAEELGFVGSLVLLSLYSVVLIGGIRAALLARDKFGRLLATGATVMMFTHVFINMAMTIGLLPITGIPLPLISYGGSFMMVIMIGLGLIQSVYTRRIT